MNAFIAVTDFEWFSLLGSQIGIEEVNFWQPNGNRVFSAIEKGGLFLFKLHSPRDFIVGGGFYAHSTLLPVSLAWDTFGIKNGATTYEQMRKRIEKFRRQQALPHEDYSIGCILLEQPFFFAKEQWFPVPKDWKSNIVQGKRYDLTLEPGLSLFKQVQERMAITNSIQLSSPKVADPRDKYGAPINVLPRLGQGSFRIVVTDAYDRKCAITGEKVLPVLVASHIRPYANGGTHDPQNGILLRSDMHTLFDRGYVTITDDYHFEVSKRIKEDFDNGHEYYAYHGKNINIPKQSNQAPGKEYLDWHHKIYRG
jgi:putative restriction endonuclease